MPAPTQTAGKRLEAARFITTAGQQGKLIRVMMAVMTCAVAGYWIGFTWAAALLTVQLAFEWIINPWCIERLVNPWVKTRPKRAQAMGLVLMVVGATLFVVAWGSAWAVGGDEAGYFAATMVAGSMIHALTYYSRSRWLFFACIAPTLLTTIVVPVVIGISPVLALITLVVTCGNTFRVWRARQDRQHLQKVLAASQTAQRLAEEANTAKSQFLATMSHELRTPLNAIIGYSEILAEDLEGPARTGDADDAYRIQRAARHLLHLINTVLDLSKVEAGRLDMKKAPVDVAALLADIEETVRPLAQRHRNEIRIVTAADCVVEADPSILKQCVLNLATNACKFTRDGVITLRAHVAGEALSIAVEDSGIGIAPADQARLFQPFVQVDGSETRAQDGSGLGLVITRKLAQAMGGDVSLVSAPGKGSTFTLTIAAPRPDIAPAPTGDTAHPTVLVIEDEPATRDITMRALSRLPLRLHAAGTSAEGYELAVALQPDLIVLDINLPDGSGWDLLAHLKAHARATPVLVVTCEDDRGRALALGACEHLLKPVDRDRLTAAVLRYTQQRQAAAA